ncbi:MAG: hypothetical protein DHS20C14_01830 [Phycisphaeraceae bacterium]|nr:MAG: hypothetical protein DHS20C14_01830 [Phycisphaeraceae bacterium]
MLGIKPVCITMSLTAMLTATPAMAAAGSAPQTFTRPQAAASTDGDPAGGVTQLTAGAMPNPDDLIAYWPCASAAPASSNPHYFSFSLNKQEGWKNLLKSQLMPAVEDLGFKRLAFHLPLGKNTAEDGHMGIDAPDDLAEDGHEWVIDKCVRAFDYIHKRHPDVEIIVYLGSHDADQDDDLNDGEYWEHYDRMWRGVQPFLDRDYISIVLDNTVVFDEDHPYARLAQIVKYYKDRQGRFVGVEGSPQKHLDWTRDFAVMITESTWQRQRHNGNIALSDLGGEVIGIVDGHSKKYWNENCNGDPMELAACIVEDGRTPAVQVWCEFKDMTAQEIAEEIGRRNSGTIADGSDS